MGSVRKINTDFSQLKYDNIYQYDGYRVKFVKKSINNLPSTNKEVRISIDWTTVDGNVDSEWLLSAVKV